MSTVVVGISDCRLSDSATSMLVTYALGSCIAVAVYDPATKAGGLLHFMLPESKLNASRAQLSPYTFADSGIDALLGLLRQRGLNPRRCVVRLAGGAQVLDSHGVFAIGKRNYLAAKKILWKEGLLIAAEAVGGQVARTVRLDLASGKFWVREAGCPDTELLKGGELCRSMS